MRRYETTYILRSGLGEDQVQAVIDRANAIITDAGGAIIFLDRWGLRKLAFEVKKENQGLYIHMDYASPPEAVTELERIFKIDDRLLRYLTIRTADEIDASTIDLERVRREEVANIAAARAAAGDEGADNQDDENEDDEN